MRTLIDRTRSHALLEVDGGIKPDNADAILSAGQTFGGGFRRVSGGDYAAAITALRAGHEPPLAPEDCCCPMTEAARGRTPIHG